MLFETVLNAGFAVTFPSVPGYLFLETKLVQGQSRYVFFLKSLQSFTPLEMQSQHSTAVSTT